MRKFVAMLMLAASLGVLAGAGLAQAAGPVSVTIGIFAPPSLGTISPSVIKQQKLLRQTGATAIFITHSIEEALWLGVRLMVFERPARVAYETTLRAAMSEAERGAVRDRIRKVLSGEG